jgi:hypothetical protein
MRVTNNGSNLGLTQTNQRKDYTMSNPMSRDRVRFTIRGDHECRLRGLIRNVFGLNIASHDGNDITVVCRPSQFARFLIGRDAQGHHSSFKELNAELFTPRSTFTEYDVSKNPNTICAPES